MKQPHCDRCRAILRRTPRGVRGLKPGGAVMRRRRGQSHPARGAWIETSSSSLHIRHNTVAPREGCVD